MPVITEHQGLRLEKATVTGGEGALASPTSHAAEHVDAFDGMGADLFSSGCRVVTVLSAEMKKTPEIAQWLVQLLAEAAAERRTMTGIPRESIQRLVDSLPPPDQSLSRAFYLIGNEVDALAQTLNKIGGTIPWFAKHDRDAQLIWSTMLPDAVFAAERHNLNWPWHELNVWAERVGRQDIAGLAAILQSAQEWPIAEGAYKYLNEYF